MYFINEKESCQCTITYMVLAVNVFESTWSQDNENEVDVLKKVQSRTWEYYQRKLECNNSCKDDTFCYFRSRVE